MIAHTFVVLSYMFLELVGISRSYSLFTHMYTSPLSLKSSFPLVLVYYYWVYIFFPFQHFNKRCNHVPCFYTNFNTVRRLLYLQCSFWFWSFSYTYFPGRTLEFESLYYKKINVENHDDVFYWVCIFQVFPWFNVTKFCFVNGTAWESTEIYSFFFRLYLWRNKCRMCLRAYFRLPIKTEPHTVLVPLLNLVNVRKSKSNSSSVWTVGTLQPSPWIARNRRMVGDVLNVTVRTSGGSHSEEHSDPSRPFSHSHSKEWCIRGVRINRYPHFDSRILWGRTTDLDSTRGFHFPLGPLPRKVRGTCLPGQVVSVGGLRCHSFPLKRF